MGIARRKGDRGDHRSVLSTRYLEVRCTADTQQIERWLNHELERSCTSSPIELGQHARNLRVGRFKINQVAGDSWNRSDSVMVLNQKTGKEVNPTSPPGLSIDRCLLRVTY